jgi:hypothetical protein
MFDLIGKVPEDIINKKGETSGSPPELLSLGSKRTSRYARRMPTRI